MERGKVIVSGTGCCLIDRIYNGVDFAGPVFAKYLTKTKGDGGLEPGKLEFEEEFEKFTGRPFDKVLEEMVGGRKPDTVNIGGPCIVALIAAAQMTEGMSEVSFYGMRSDDEVGSMLMEKLALVPVGVDHYQMEPGLSTASTTVFSDPSYDDGQGERIFVNTIGASWKYDSRCLPPEFYDADIVVFGATAIVPRLHDTLDEGLSQARSKGCLTIVNTVFDSRNERLHPDLKWPMGKSDDCYKDIDVLVTDKEEALRLSGRGSIEEAVRWFQSAGVGAAMVTNGSRNVFAYASSPKFIPLPVTAFPVCAAVAEAIRKGVKGDTTGCGDNFAGGVIASLVRQIYSGGRLIDMSDACRWGVVSGGFACFYTGGTYYEAVPGEKSGKLQSLYEDYCRQLGETGKN